MLSIVHCLKLQDNRLYIFLLDMILAIMPISDGTRIRLRHDFLTKDKNQILDHLNDISKNYPRLNPIPITNPPKSLDKFASRIIFPTVQKPLVSIIISTHNQIERTLCCLNSIATNPPTAPYEIILVDDASTDDSTNILPLIAGPTLIRNSNRLYWQESANKGATKAQGRFVLFLNNATEVQPDWLDSLLEVFDHYNDAGLVASKIIYPSGHLQEAGRRLKNGNKVLIGYYDNPALPQYNYIREIDFCSDTAMMVPLELFKRLGGFNKALIPYDDADLAYRIREKGKKIYYQPKSVICQVISNVPASHKKLPPATTLQNYANFLKKHQQSINSNDQLRIMAFYLPQFHSIPENDEWWGKGFTEWTNVKKAKPNFEGHYQPKVPTDLRYYDLLDCDSLKSQLNLAKQYGVDAFCFYYYWFNGKKLLESPLEMLLSNKSLDFPFCICWANEDWTRTWDGESNNILIKQEYSPTAYENFIIDIFPLFEDDRYLTINNRPVLLIYRAQKIENCQSALEEWRSYCSERGVSPYIVSVDSFGEATGFEHHKLGFDAIVDFPPHSFAKPYQGDVKITNHDFRGSLFDYETTCRAFIDKRTTPHRHFRCAMPAWDNTARRQDEAHIFLKSSPEYYEKWLTENIEYTRDFFQGEEKLTFINAWNEWGEGNYLEPDTTNGLNFLEATKKARDKATHVPIKEIKLAIIIHAFYPDILREILLFLDHTPVAAKLFVTVPQEKATIVRDILDKHILPYYLLPVENKGRDILPFLNIIDKTMSEGYQLFLKVHTKKSRHLKDGDLWRKDLYQKLLSPKSVERNTLFLTRNPNIGLIGPHGYIVPMSVYWLSNQKLVLELAERLGLNEQVVKKQSFIAGTMFFGKIEAIKPLLKLHLTPADFEEEADQVNTTMAHAVERAFALSAITANMGLASYDNFFPRPWSGNQE